MGFKPAVEIVRTEGHFVDSYGRGTHYLVGRRTFDGKRARSLYLQDEIAVGTLSDILEGDEDYDTAIEREFGDFLDVQPLEDMFS